MDFDREIEAKDFSNRTNMFTNLSLASRLRDDLLDSVYQQEVSTSATIFYSASPHDLNFGNFSVYYNNSEYEKVAWMRHTPTVSVLFCIAYSLIFVMGICGNSFVVAVVWRSPRMRTVTNYFIVNLALADILVVLFCLPATLVGNLVFPWTLGWFMCKSVSYLQGVSVSASINTLVAISIDRFLAICYPLRCQMSTRAARRIILLIWAFSLTITLPWAIYFKIETVTSEDRQLQLCVEDWPEEEYEKWYFLLANLVLCYLLPLCFITVCYLCIWIKVWRRNIPGETKGTQMDFVVQRSKLKVVKMMVVVVVIFVLSWLPLYIIFARVKFGRSMDNEIGLEETILTVSAPIAQWLGASNSCINPVLYAYFNKKFRKGFVAIMKSKKCCGTLRFDTRPRQNTTFRSAYRITSRTTTQCDYLSTSAV